VSADLAGLVAAARAVQPGWAALSWRERSRRLRPLQRYLVDGADRIAALIARESGKTLSDALATEVLPAVLALDFYRRRGRRLLASRPVGGGSILLFNKRSRLVFEPFGVVGIISPWNYPFAIPFSELVMALLAGNAVLFKVASDSREVGRELEQAFAAADLPPGLVTGVDMPGREAGPAFIDSGLDKLFFTGSTAVGQELMARAATRLLPLVLELGGCDAAIVRADADLDRAAAGILWAGYSNAGQSCGGAQRILVHRSVYDAFLRKLGARVAALRVAGDGGHDSDMGQVLLQRQRRAVREQVGRCLAAGARIAARSVQGDLEGEGPLLPALLLADIAVDAPVMREEIFGPVTAVLPVDDDEQALRIANDSPYGLTASVWSRDRRTARALAARLNAGAVTINDHLMSHGLAETPWGGFGQSGLGRTHGLAGLLEMVKMKVVVDDILPGVKKNLWWHPYSETVYRGLKAILDVRFGSNAAARLAALPRLVRFFLRYWDRS